MVDAGFEKGPYYEGETGFERMIVTEISKASARQRAGRAGRTSPGKCYRLYTPLTFSSFLPSHPPAIQRTPLTQFVLTLKALGIDSILSFDLLSPVSVPSLTTALEELHVLDCIDNECKLTKGWGDVMAEFPVEPRLAAMLMESLEEECTEEILSIG